LLSATIVPSPRRLPHSIFNRRRTRHAAFRSLLGIGLTLKPASYQMLIAPEARA
jgi:hypothetical protein